MHIPDGLLSVPIVTGAYAVSAGGVGLAVRQVNKKLKEKQVPLMGVLAAFIFGAQMLNFPIPGGTSGHVIGAALAAVLLGPWTAMLILTCVLMAQCFIFQDGGLLALGANILNMAVVASLTSYGVYRLSIWVFRDSRKGQLIGSFMSAWTSVVIAAVACSFELFLSGVSPLAVVLPAMAGVHSIIGIGEGAVTVAVVSLVMSVRVDLMEAQKI